MSQPKLKDASSQRRPKMEPTSTASLDRVRARVIASGGPSLAELRSKFGGWPVAELSGRMAGRAGGGCAMSDAVIMPGS
jgi:hypothetical protein